MTIFANSFSSKLFTFWGFIPPCRFKITGLFLIILITILNFNGSAQNVPPGFREEIDCRLKVDSSAKIFISAIDITGNKKTKRYIIEREMRAKEGESILAANIFEILKTSQELIYNTTLFTEVVLMPFFISATEMSISVTVKEKWFIYPSPQFKLTDRNLNEWINTHNADLERVVYGAKFAHYNLSGRRDQLRIFLLNGYARNFSFSYSAPYSNRALTEGFAIGAGYTQNREVIYKTNDSNLLLRYRNTGFASNTFLSNASYIMRKGYFKKHIFKIGFTHINVNDSISKKLNPSYFNNNKNYVSYPELAYSFQYIHTNNVNYPLTGKLAGLGITKRGFGLTGNINMLSMTGSYTRYLSHGKNWYSSVQGIANIILPFKQPYINQKAFGYGEFYLRGLENYVVDGVANLMAQYTLKKKILSFKIPVPIKNKIVSHIPITLFAKTFADMGYSYNKAEFNSRLGNRLLYTGGFGIDILTLYDINFKLEYSFNQLGEKGLFLHTKGGF